MNPFHQSAHHWQIRIHVDRSFVADAEEAMNDLALAVASFEVKEDSEQWCVEILTGAPPADSDIQSRLALMAGLRRRPTPRFEIRELVPKDWVSEVQRNFPPFSIGRFYVHGSHVKEVPQGAIALRVDAGAAFGSGEHATTSGCLLALSGLAKSRRFLRPLDMGCGSGILAIAMAKLWRTEVAGIDIDPVSIGVARDNAMNNRVGNYTYFAAGNGYQAPLVRRHAPFDLIVANILARPLIAMAPELAKNLAPGGVAILSGLLAKQERMVLAAHREQGLKLLRRVCREGWNTLIIAC